MDQLPDKEPTFVDNYNNDYDPDLEDVEAGYYRTHGYYAACGYVATNVMLDAIEQDYKNDKEVTREGIVRELLAPRTHNGVLGEWSFEENGDTNLDKISVYRVQDRHFAWDYEEDKVSAVYDVSQ